MVLSFPEEPRPARRCLRGSQAAPRCCSGWCSLRPRRPDRGLRSGPWPAPRQLRGFVPCHCVLPRAAPWQRGSEVWPLEPTRVVLGGIGSCGESRPPCPSCCCPRSPASPQAAPHEGRGRLLLVGSLRSTLLLQPPWPWGAAPGVSSAYSGLCCYGVRSLCLAPTLPRGTLVSPAARPGPADVKARRLSPSCPVGDSGFSLGTVVSMETAGVTQGLCGRGTWSFSSSGGTSGPWACFRSADAGFRCVSPRAGAFFLVVVNVCDTEGATLGTCECTVHCRYAHPVHMPPNPQSSHLAQSEPVPSQLPPPTARHPPAPSASAFASSGTSCGAARSALPSWAWLFFLSGLSSGRPCPGAEWLLRGLLT